MNKIDRYADMFTTLLITVIELLIAAALLACGLTALPQITFTGKLVAQVFAFVVGIKALLAGFKVKNL